MSTQKISTATRLCARCGAPRMRAVQHTRYRGVERVTFACDRCGGGFTVIDQGAGVSVFFGLLGLVFLLGPWLLAWRDGVLGERIALLATFETRSKAWQDMAFWQGLSGLVGVSTLWMFVSWASMRRAMARNPIASKVTSLSG